MGTNGDAEELKSHPFFADINWDALYNRQIEAEYKPQVPEEQKHSEQLLLSPQAKSAEDGVAEGDGGNHAAMGHSIMEEDAKEEMTAQQVEFVRQHQHQFHNF